MLRKASKEGRQLYFVDDGMLPTGFHTIPTLRCVDKSRGVYRVRVDRETYEVGMLDLINKKGERLYVYESRQSYMDAKRLTASLSAMRIPRSPFGW